MSIITHRYNQIDPKNTRYFTNGTGRDTYISTMSTVPAVKLPKINAEQTHVSQGENSFKYKGFSSIKYSSIDNKSVHYVSDGSGRDKYIKVNEGGFTGMSGSVSTDAYFENILRNYGKMSSIHHSSNCFLPQLQRSRNKEIYQSQEILSNRLSEPKTRISKKVVGSNGLESSKVVNTL